MAFDLYTIAGLRSAVGEGRADACLHGQVETLLRKETKDGKPFFELTLSDGQNRLTLRAWNDSPAFPTCEGFSGGEFVEVSGEFVRSSSHGLDARRWQVRRLRDEERQAVLAGPPEVRSKQAEDYGYILGRCEVLGDPRLRALCMMFLHDLGERFRRTAGARSNHHARRGGLVEHVAQMMRSAEALADVYTELNLDLLLAGVLFHDCGKLWENHLPADTFSMPFDERGEMLGHITIGIETVNALWRKLMQSDVARDWISLDPPSDDVRMHLLHLVASHHGEMQYGAPVVPKTPEATALHYIDNLDARLDMFQQGYTQSRALAPRIQERVWPLPGHLIAPLPPFAE